MSRADPRPMKNVTKPTIIAAGTCLTTLTNKTHSYISWELTCATKIDVYTDCSLHQGHHRAKTS